MIKSELIILASRWDIRNLPSKNEFLFEQSKKKIILWISSITLYWELVSRAMGIWEFEIRKQLSKILDTLLGSHKIAFPGESPEKLIRMQYCDSDYKMHIKLLIFKIVGIRSLGILADSLSPTIVERVWSNLRRPGSGMYCFANVEREKWFLAVRVRHKRTGCDPFQP